MLTSEKATPVSGDADVNVCISFRVRGGIGNVGTDGARLSRAPGGGHGRTCARGLGNAAAARRPPVAAYSPCRRPAAPHAHAWCLALPRVTRLDHASGGCHTR